MVKIQLSSFTRVGALTLNGGEDNLLAVVGDLANDYAYFGTAATGANPAQVVKVQLSTMTRIEALAFHGSELYASAAFQGPSSLYAYFTTSTNPGNLVRVQVRSATFLYLPFIGK